MAIFLKNRTGRQVVLASIILLAGLWVFRTHLVSTYVDFAYQQRPARFDPEFKINAYKNHSWIPGPGVLYRTTQGHWSPCPNPAGCFGAKVLPPAAAL